MTKGKPWTVDEDLRLKELVEKGLSIDEIAAELNKSREGVRQKMLKFGLVEQQPRDSCCCCSSTKVGLPETLPDVEEAIKREWRAMDMLEQQGLSHCEIQRNKAIILEAKVYRELFAAYVGYQKIAESVAEMRKEFREEIRKISESAKGHEVGRAG